MSIKMFIKTKDRAEKTYAYRMLETSGVGNL